MYWGKWYVLAVAAFALVQLLGYEAYALLNKRPNDTISAFVWEMIAGRPWLAAVSCVVLLLSTGLLAGHFFWGRSWTGVAE